LVIKIPKFQGGDTYSNPQVLQKDLQLIKKYFPKLATATTFMVNDQNTDYAVIQKFCQDSTEIVRDMDALVRRQLETIISQNKKLFRNTRHSLDLFGSSGFITSLLSTVLPGIKPKLSNILLRKKADKSSLLLVDTELLRLTNQSTSWTSMRFHIRSWISYKLTSFLLRRAFNFASA
jgi:hypothetical protein